MSWLRTKLMYASSTELNSSIQYIRYIRELPKDKTELNSSIVYRTYIADTGYNCHLKSNIKYYE